MKKYSIWADSFHEGIWCCDHLKSKFEASMFNVEINYIQGFIPIYYFSNPNTQFMITVFGSYDSWKHLPDKIKELKKYGKPDFVCYSEEDDEIVFAVEETAAIPTGNQSMQRCERQYGAAKSKIPYWYLLPEYAEHKDGGIRRDSIWPSISAIKLMSRYKTPNVVLHYAGITNLNDYNAGDGVKLLFDSLQTLIMANYNCEDTLSAIKKDLQAQIFHMFRFIKNQYESITNYLPGEQKLTNGFAAFLVEDMINTKQTVQDWKYDLFHWETLGKLPHEFKEQCIAHDLIKYDKLCFAFENDIKLKKCYVLSSNSGSGRPQSESAIKNYIFEQKELFESVTSKELNRKINFELKIDDFPKTENGNVHITTSKNIVYLYDSLSDLAKTICDCFPELNDVFNGYEDKPVLVYISNSIKKNRIYGDPFVGQLACYTTVFGKFDSKSRYVLTYYPHQVYQTLLVGRLTKGKKILFDCVDFVLFNAGVFYDVNRKEFK